MYNLIERKISLVMLALLFLVSGGIIALVAYLDVLPTKFLAVFIVFVVLLFVYSIFSQMTERKTYIAGRFLILVFFGLYGAIAYYGMTTIQTLDSMAVAQEKVDKVRYLVLAGDKAQTLADTKAYRYGALETIDVENTNQALDFVKSKLKQEVAVSRFEDADSMVQALYNGEVQVIVLNNSFEQGIKEHFKTFKNDVRALEEYEIRTKIDNDEDEKDDKVASDITTRPFNVYISGIDVYGDINQTSRSDVNIIATINPVSKEILLIATPRDYYVPMANSNGQPDKLTHAGEFGVDNSRKTLEMLYGIDIDYYIRVNFTSLKKIVNTLGGVSVYSDQDFTCDWGPNGAGTHYYFKKGYNKVNGKMALGFCRERHHFTTGDRQRAKNHQYMFEAILTKAMSPAILPKYTKLLALAKKMTQTNFKTKDMTALAKMQLDDMSQWKISSYSVDGSNARKTTFTYRSRPLYVMIPNQKTVEKAKKKIDKVYNSHKTGNEK